MCTTVTPLAGINRLAAVRGDGAALCATYHVRHLPQGAPTSPALANLPAWRLEVRLIARMTDLVTKIAGEAGFHLNHAKTRIMPGDQSQCVTGLVVRAHINVGRAEFDTLKAILQHCVHGDPHHQNRAAVPDFRRSLNGPLAWVEQVNPHRGSKLRRIFEQIDWIQ